ncbi:MAG: diversity-generating retroelement protein Avd [Candidatus Margulisiibacteriota bacterium]
MREELGIISLTYDCMKYLIPVASKFPRNQRYLLGERIENHLCDILENLLEAKYTKAKKPLLYKANLMLEKMRYFVRLSHDLELIDVRRYGYISDQLNQIGVQLGGWIKQLPQ